MTCTYENIEYGPSVTALGSDPVLNAVIPMTGKPKLQIKAVYGDDGVQIMYYEYTLSIDTVIYDKTTQLLDVEEEVARLRTILLTPNYKLKLSPVGLGDMPIINVDMLDVKGGPYPQDLVIEPIASNKAIAVHWVVMFRIKHCAVVLSGLVQYNSEIDFDVDDDGDITFNLRATFQRTTPFKDAGDLNAIAALLVRNSGKSFQGMTRRKRTSFSRDMRTAHVHIELKEIKSDNAFYPGTRNIEATDEISSDLAAKGFLQGKGFYSWNRRITAKIRLPARTHKSYAWVIFLKIVAERLKNLQGLTKAAAFLGNDVPAGMADNPERQKNFHLLTKLVLKNEIYTRSMSFIADYFLVTDFTEFITKTKICDRVNTRYTGVTPWKLSDQWEAWQVTGNLDLNGIGKYSTSGLPIVYNQCAGLYTDANVGGTSLLNFEDEFYALSPDEKKLPQSSGSAPVRWIQYQNDFMILEETKNVQVSYIQPTPTSTYYQAQEAEAALDNRNATGFRIHSKYSSQDGSSTKSKTINRGTSTFQIRMFGRAVRLQDKIHAPSLVSVAGRPVSRTGNPQFIQTEIASGEIPIYAALWDITYNVDGDIFSEDILQTLKTNAAPGLYI